MCRLLVAYYLLLENSADYWKMKTIIWSFWLLIFCLIQRTISVDGSVQTTEGCEDGWSEHRGNCFRLYSSEKTITWIGAEKQCNDEDSHLASIRDQQEMSFVHQLLMNSNITHKEAYIGLKLNTNAKEYRWTDGRPMTYTNWFIPRSSNRWPPERQPDRGWLQACTKLLSSDAESFTSYWHDIPCASPETQQFVCVKQAEPRMLQPLQWKSHEKEVGCSQTFYTCSSGECIHKIFVCDGSRDCTDGSDERICDNAFGVMWHKADITSGCGVNQVRCRDSYQCISVSHLCDFIPHCQDGSDETQCDYTMCEPSTEFRCNSGQCIDQNKRCDLIDHCLDRSDEMDCDYSSVGFQCFDGTWLPLSAVCDGQADCTGGNWEDEPMECQNHTMIGNEVLCTNGALMEQNYACQYDVDNYGRPIGCRDMTHLIGCEDTECPESTLKCPNSYCINVRYRCDGKWHCPNGEDEYQCDDFACPGFYRCHGYRHCVTADHICDGIKQCPDGDDELFCDTLCPAGCSCVGHSYSCQGIAWDPIKAQQLPGGLRQLHLISVEAALNTDGNGTIENILFVDFKRLKMLFILDICKNDISHLKPGQFKENVNLKKLILSDNAIYHLQNGIFAGLHALEYLDLSGNPLISVDADVYVGLKKLVFLDMTTMNNMAVRPSKALYSPLTELKTLWSSEFMICCLVEDSDTISECLPGDSNEFSNCEDLICNKFLRLFMWVLGFSALIGNAFVIIWRTCGGCRVSGRNSSVQSILVSNLAVADLLMGVYMLIVAAADKYYRPRFMEEAHNWQTSTVCNIAGFLAILSSEASIFFLTIISLDRFICISFPFSSQKLTPKRARVAAIVAWAIVFLISAVPPIAPGYFGEKYYGRSSVCLALPLISRHRSRGYHYSLAIFLGLNLILFLIMLLCYIAMYFIVRASSRSIQTVGKSSARDQVQLALRMGFLIGTNFLCWMPIIICGLLSVAEVWELHPVIYAWVAVFVLPLNASLNPYLYTILTREMSNKKRSKGKSGSRFGDSTSSSVSRMTISEKVNSVMKKETKDSNRSLNIMTSEDMMTGDKNDQNGRPNLKALTSGGSDSLFETHIEDQRKSRIFLVRYIDHYKSYLMSNYMTKTDKWPGFKEKDIESIRQDLEDAVKMLHRQGIKHGSIDEKHVLLEETDGSKRCFLVISAISDWHKSTQNESKEPKMSDFDQLEKFIISLPRATASANN